MVTLSATRERGAFAGKSPIPMVDRFSEVEGESLYLLNSLYLQGFNWTPRSIIINLKNAIVT
jgi:hypothetical protein